jgi:hypothetical protein
LAQSGHAMMQRTCPLSGAKRTWSKGGVMPAHDLLL